MAEGTGPGPGRVQYRTAGRCARWSLQRALDGDASGAELRVLAAVHQWTTTYSKLEDWITLGQVAVVAGLWRGRARECPRTVTREVARRLKRLRSMGAVVYEPAVEEGPGSRSRIGVPFVGREVSHPPSHRGQGRPAITGNGGGSPAGTGVGDPREGGSFTPAPEKSPGKVTQDGESPTSASGLAADDEASAAERADALAGWLEELLKLPDDDPACRYFADLFTDLDMAQHLDLSRWILAHQDLVVERGPAVMLAWASETLALDISTVDLKRLPAGRPEQGPS